MELTQKGGAGGDEFVMLLPEMDQDGALAAVDRIRSCMQAFNSEYEGPLVSISLGSATAAAADEIPLALKDADERMYADKVQCKQQRTDSGEGGANNAYLDIADNCDNVFFTVDAIIYKSSFRNDSSYFTPDGNCTFSGRERVSGKASAYSGGSHE